MTHYPEFSLQKLSLSGNAIGTEGAVHLAEALGMSTGDGFSGYYATRHIVTLICNDNIHVFHVLITGPNRHLIWLDLSKNHLSNEAALVLGDALQVNNVLIQVGWGGNDTQCN